MSVKEAQTRIDSAEFSEWMAYASIDPFLIDRSENMLAIIASILANIHRPKGHRAFKPEDFIPEYGPKKIESPEDIFIKLRSAFGNH